MNVLQLFTTTNPHAVVAAHNKSYPTYPVSLETYHNEFLSVIRNIPLEKTTNVIEISHYQIKHDDPSDDLDKIDVSLVDQHGDVYSLSFRPRRVILACDVLCEIPTPFPVELQAAHLFWEITIHGIDEEDSIEVRDQVLDAFDNVSKIDRNDAEHNADTLGEVLNTPLRSQNLFDALFPDDTSEERAEREADAQKMLVNYKTRKIYKNGILRPSNDDPDTRLVKDR